MFLLNPPRTSSQNSLELRWASPQDERFTYIAGRLLPARRAGFRRPDLPAHRQRRRAAGGLRHHRQPPGCRRLPRRHLGLPEFRAEHLQQLRLRPGERGHHRRWRASLGLRYSHIEKEAIRILREGDLERVPFNLNDANDFDRLSAGTVLFASIFKVSFHQLSGSLDGRQHRLRAGQRLRPHRRRHGLRLGQDRASRAAATTRAPTASPRRWAPPAPAPCTRQAWRTRSTPLVPPGSFEYKPEKALASGGGHKMSLLNGTAELNVTVFRTKFDDLQVSIFDGTLGFNVGNAASAITQGVELDGRWALTDDWSLNGSAGLPELQFRRFHERPVQPGPGPHLPQRLSATTPARPTSTSPIGRATWR